MEKGDQAEDFDGVPLIDVPTDSKLVCRWVAKQVHNTVEPFPETILLITFRFSLQSVQGYIRILDVQRFVKQS